MRAAPRKMNGSKAAATVTTAAAAAAAVLFAMETKMRLIDGLRKANRQVMCGEEEGCGWRVERLERRISGKQPPIGGKVRSKNY